MSKLDTLIAACMTAEDIGPMTFTPARVLAIRRILEAVREDMGNASKYCDFRQRSGDCTAWAARGRACPNCPAQHYATTLAALEQL